MQAWRESSTIACGLRWCSGAAAYKRSTTTAHQAAIALATLILGACLITVPDYTLASGAGGRHSTSSGGPSGGGSSLSGNTTSSRTSLGSGSTSSSGYPPIGQWTAADLTVSWFLNSFDVAPPFTQQDSGGQYCITTTTGAYSFGLAYPSTKAGASFSLTAGTSYTLSYEASLVNGGLASPDQRCIAGEISPQIGLQATPYTKLRVDCDRLSAQLTTFTHTFTPTASVSGLGILFSVNLSAGSEVCFGTIALTQN